MKNIKNVLIIILGVISILIISLLEYKIYDLKLEIEKLETKNSVDVKEAYQRGLMNGTSLNESQSKRNNNFKNQGEQFASAKQQPQKQTEPEYKSIEELIREDPDADWSEYAVDVDTEWVETPDSTSFEYIGYNIASKILYLEFRTSGSYEYYDVPMWLWEEFKDAESKGRFYNDEIKPYYDYG